MISLIRQLFGSGRKSEWNSFKLSEGVYPVGPIGLISMNSESGGLLTGWVNKGYKDYPYKRFCRHNFLIKVNLLDKLDNSNPDLDMETVENYFIGSLRKVCISHLVARLATDNGLDIECYLENQDAGMICLLQLSNDPERPFNFSYENNYDPSWSAVQGLFEL